MKRAKTERSLPRPNPSPPPRLILELKRPPMKYCLGASAEDRFILASYYLDGRTLAEIARTLAVHESTISRKLDKLAKSLRKQIVTRWSEKA